jgi:hypothetical protein
VSDSRDNKADTGGLKYCADQRQGKDEVSLLVELLGKDVPSCCECFGVRLTWFYFFRFLVM